MVSQAKGTSPTKKQKLREGIRLCSSGARIQTQGWFGSLCSFQYTMLPPKASCVSEWDRKPHLYFEARALDLLLPPQGCKMGRGTGKRPAEAQCMEEAGCLESQRGGSGREGEVLTQVVCQVSETAPGEVSREQLRGMELPLRSLTVRDPGGACGIYLNVSRLAASC